MCLADQLTVSSMADVQIRQMSSKRKRGAEAGTTDLPRLKSSLPRLKSSLELLPGPECESFQRPRNEDATDAPKLRLKSSMELMPGPERKSFQRPRNADAVDAPQLNSHGPNGTRIVSDGGSVNAKAPKRSEYSMDEDSRRPKDQGQGDENKQHRPTNGNDKGYNTGGSGSKKKKEKRDKDDQNKDDSIGHLNADAGQVLGGRFTVTSLLGEGTFGKVYECQDAKHDDTVAVKCIRSVDKYITSGK